jgi:CHAT domain-containing protein/tetratricopeptide (TPR) repeat protein
VALPLAISTSLGPDPSLAQQPAQGQSPTLEEALAEGKRLLELWKYAEAETFARDALQLAEAAHGAQSLQVADALDLLVKVLLRAGRETEPELEELALRAVFLREQIFGAADPSLAGSLSSLGLLYQHVGKPESAVSNLRRALAIHERALPADHLDVARSLNRLAAALGFAGELTEARSLYTRALAIREKRLGAEHPEVAKILSNLAGLLADMGELTEARSMFDRALPILEKTYGTSHLELGPVLLGFGTLLADLGDYERALALLRRDLEISEKSYGTTSLAVGLILIRMGIASMDSGDLQGAERAYRRALGIYDELGVPQISDAGTAWTNLGIVAWRGGKRAEAITLSRRALPILESALGEEDLQVAICRNNLGEALAAGGQTAEARPLLERAMDTWTRALGAEHPYIVATTNGMALLDWHSGEFAAAMKKALRAEEIRRAGFRHTVQALSEREALAYHQARYASLDLVLGALTLARPLHRDPESVRMAWDAVTRSRALVLDELAARRHALSAEESSELSDLTGALRRSRGRLAGLRTRSLGSTPLAEHLEQLRKVEEEAEGIERALAERSLAFREELRLSGTGLNEVLSHLPPSSALVAFVRYEQYSASLEDASPSYAAFVAKAGSPPRFVPLGPAQAIDPLVRDWQRAILAGQRDLTGRAGAETKYRGIARGLRQAVWEPIAADLAPASLIFVVPDGALHFVNLATLPEGAQGFLAETAPLFHHLSTERDLARGPAPAGPREALLAIGNPDFDRAESKGPVAPNERLQFRGQTPGCRDFRSLKFVSLPGAAAEAEEIGALWKARGPSTLVLRGPEADEAAFKRLASKHSVLHLATHGFVLGDDCAATPASEHLMDPRGLQGRSDGLLISGLALAGANRRDQAPPQAGSEDGILTAEEISALDLSHVEWVVLSACQTGVGTAVEGEGILGLQRAFTVAGARSIIMSLWPVDDQATLRWMRELYEGRLRGLSTAESVRQATLSQIARGRELRSTTHPFFWGAFVGVGDWR